MRKLTLLIVLCVTAGLQAADPWTITTIAGPHPNNGGAVSNAQLYRPFSLALDEANNKLYIADRNINQIRVVDLSATPTPTIDVLAGTNLGGYNGDNIAASSATLYYPFGVGFANGNVYICDSSNNRIRRVNSGGTITTVAGNGTEAYGGDGGQAASASLAAPWGVAVDSNGVIYIADSENNRVRKVATDGTITTIAGTGTAGYSGDSGQAVNATLNFPQKVALDGLGHLFIADSFNGALRQVDLSSGVITTLLQTASGGVLEDVACDASNVLYAATDTQIFTIDQSNNNAVTVLAGDGVSNPANSQDGSATGTAIWPTGIAVSSTGTVYLCEETYGRLRKIESGQISTLAGGSSGDGASALTANVVRVIGMKADSAGNVYLADFHGNRIRKIDTSGNISTFAGTGVNGTNGNGGAAISAQLKEPADVVIDSQGNIFFSEVGAGDIRKVSAADGTISIFASSLGDCYGLGIDANDNIYASSFTRALVYKVLPNGTASVFAGTTPGYGGDGGAATSAKLKTPEGVAADSDGNVYIIDLGNSRVRKVDTTGKISTICGTGVDGYNGDNIAATSAKIYQPRSIAVDGAGRIFISDGNNHRIRKIENGIITTVVGGNTFGFAGDNGPASQAAIDFGWGMSVNKAGTTLIFWDWNRFTCRKVTRADPGPLAYDGTLSTSEDTAKSGTLVGKDGDADPLTYAIVTNGAKGTAVITNAATGAYTYTPNANTNGSDSFTFKVNDGSVDSNTATITVTINPVNDAPVANDGTLTTNEDTAGSATLSATDIDSPNLTYSIVANGAHGTAVVTNATTGAYTYTPAANFNGTDAFTFKANDGSLDSNTATINVTVNAVNDAPVANDGTLTTNEDTAGSGTLSATDVDSPNLTYSIVANAAHGTALITNTATGAYTYTPAANFNGTDTFTFKANDGSLDSNTATITVTITPVNDAPVASDGTLTTNEDTAGSGTLSATDVDSPNLTYSIVANAAHGTALITNAATGAYTYTPVANFNGIDSFTFKANDGALDSNAVAITVTINPVNDAPVANDGTLTINEDTVGSSTLVATDIDSPNLTYSIVTNGAKGTAVITNAATGAYSYTPNLNANGSDTFTFKANDGSLDSNTATITVTIIPVNDAPALTSAAAATPATADTSTAIAFAVAASDADNDALTYAWVFGDGAAGSGATASHTYASPGTFTATVTISDPAGATVSSSVQVTITAPAGPPGPAGTPGDTDGDGFPDALEVALGSSPTDPADTPFGGKPAGTVEPLATGKLTINFNFARASSDSLTLTGSLPVPTAFAPLGQTVVLDVGGVVRLFTLNTKGQSKTGSDAFQLAAKKGATTARFTAKLTKASLAASLADEGLTNQTVNKAARTVRVIVLFNQTFFQSDANLTYSAKAGKTGVAK